MVALVLICKEKTHGDLPTYRVPSASRICMLVMGWVSSTRFETGLFWTDESFEGDVLANFTCGTGLDSKKTSENAKCVKKKCELFL